MVVTFLASKNCASEVRAERDIRVNAETELWTEMVISEFVRRNNGRLVLKRKYIHQQDRLLQQRKYVRNVPETVKKHLPSVSREKEV